MQASPLSPGYRWLSEIPLHGIVCPARIAVPSEMKLIDLAEQRADEIGRKTLDTIDLCHLQERVFDRMDAKAEFDKSYAALIDTAGYFGIDEEEVIYLYEMGYSLAEIEEFIMNPKLMEEIYADGF